jgi:hypothetical protein
MKPLGQVAYEAFTADQREPWSRLTPRAQSLWDRAAAAVAHEAGKRVMANLVREQERNARDAQEGRTSPTRLGMVAK